MTVSVGAVAIARNEGERLKNCLRSLVGACARVVYVDSGSTDGSVDFARGLGVEVVPLDLSKPFSMARARNAGVARLREILPGVERVQLVDGDCELDPGWLAQANAWLEAHPETVAVCGRRRERYPEKSVYNRLCNLEWNTPVGRAKSCGGDVLMRVAPLVAAGGFNEALIAGEEPELCLRLRQAGGFIDRIEAEMTRHDAAILSFRAWWKRTLRGGYGAMDVYTRLRGKIPDAEVPFHHLTTSAGSWTDRWLFLLALAAGAGFFFAGAPGLAGGVLLAIGLWFFQAFRIGWGVRHRAASRSEALTYGFFTMVGKWAQRAGQRRYRHDVKAGKVIKIIEYKS
jgi:glycosyltransferase involved in cell wall biosynthesis